METLNIKLEFASKSTGKVKNEARAKFNFSNFESEAPKIIAEYCKETRSLFNDLASRGVTGAKRANIAASDTIKATIQFEDELADIPSLEISLLNFGKLLDENEQEAIAYVFERIIEYKLKLNGWSA